MDYHLDIKSLLSHIGDVSAAFLGAEVTDVNQQNPIGETPLGVAIGWQDMTAIRMLIAAGADVNARMEHGETPLHAAVRVGNPEIAKYLLESGGRINSIDDFGRAPLDVARLGGREAVAEILERSLEGKVEKKRKMIVEFADQNPRP